MNRITLALAGIAALGATLVVLAVADPHEGHAAGAPTTKQLAFHDGMRKLWEDHITFTRLAIVSFAAGLPDLQATEGRLLRNQTDIGNAVKPYYGTKGGNALTKLLREHILGAVDLLQAAKSGDDAKVASASRAWYANGNEIADFLHSANPRHFGTAAMRKMMKAHLDETLKEAQDRLGGKYAADIRDYEVVHHHILAMADMLSDGVIAQFPQRFR